MEAPGKSKRGKSSKRFNPLSKRGQERDKEKEAEAEAEDSQDDSESILHTTITHHGPTAPGVSSQDEDSQGDETETFKTIPVADLASVVKLVTELSKAMTDTQASISRIAQDLTEIKAELQVALRKKGPMEMHAPTITQPSTSIGMVLTGPEPRAATSPVSDDDDLDFGGL